MRIKPVANQIYHVYNRGVEKRDIFIDEQDHFRFIHDLYEFNDRDATVNFSYFVDTQTSKGMSFDEAVKEFQEFTRSKQRDILIDILCFCLMPNHFHLMVRPLEDDALPIFMQKLAGGYTKYFNHKYTRVGPLLQGKYKSKNISDDTYFAHCTGYIHRNPIDIMPFEGKKSGKRFRNEVKKFLRTFRWSSYPDYIGIKNFPSVINDEFLRKFFHRDSKRYENFVLEWTEHEYKRLKDAKLLFDE